MKAIILGSGASGSSAVEDYLFSRPDVYRPSIKKEFRLIQDPGGISDLGSTISSEFYNNRASAAIEEFRELCNRFGRSKKGFPKGLDYAGKIRNYYEKVDHYISRITAVEYSGMPFCERAKLSRWNAYLYNREKKKTRAKGTKPDIGTVRLPVTEEEFLSETRKFLNRLLIPETGEAENKLVVVEQGGSFWTPVSSTRYYDQRKVVVVTRDPRDIYSEILDDGYAYPGRDVETFCAWFKQMMKLVNREEWSHDIVIQIRFEDFIQNFEAERERLDWHLNLPEGIPVSFDTERSKKNIGKYPDHISEEESGLIESELKEFLHY